MKAIISSDRHSEGSLIKDKILLIFTMRHFGMVNNSASVLNIGKFLHGEGIADDILDQIYLTLFIILCNAKTIQTLTP